MFKKYTSLSLFSLFVSFSVNATTLEDISKAMSIPDNSEKIAQNWKSLNKIKGIKWKDKEVLSGTFDVSRYGKLTIKDHGFSTIFFTGEKDMVFRADISIIDQKGKFFGTTDIFDLIVKDQFNKNTNIKKIRGTCPEEKPKVSTSLYEITLPKMYPVYLYVAADLNTANMEPRTSIFQINLLEGEHWKCEQSQ